MTHYFIPFLDMLLLVYFVSVGVKFKNTKISLIAFLQIVLFLFAEYGAQDAVGENFTINNLEIFMMTIINVIGGAIAIYAIYYMKFENAPKFKKNAFLVYLWIFLIIMNLAVVSNNLLYFFFFFELTTLSSYLLISFRGDQTSIKNGQNALFLNQIGGVFLLIAVLINQANGLSIFMNEIIASKNLVSISLIFIAFAAFIKGACKPFESWLLGAMVAPTPVSALLHSATMVKIAPFLILKFAPVFTDEISYSITLFGMFLFLIFAIEGLNKNNFKEILAYSTISMLALMIAVAAINNETAYEIALLLIFFHAISKAILFMLAGVLEKTYHIKYIDELGEIYAKNKTLSLMILISFATVTLPPFGLFFAKLFFLQYLASSIESSLLYLPILLFFVLGSSTLVLLYFKIASLLLGRADDASTNEKLNLGMMLPNYFLMFIMILSILALGAKNGDVLMGVIVFGFLFIMLLISLAKSKFESTKRVQVYACGEQTVQNVGQFYFDFSKFSKLAIGTSIILWIVILLGGLI